MLRSSTPKAYNIHIDTEHCREMLYFMKTLCTWKPSQLQRKNRQPAYTTQAEYI